MTETQKPFTEISIEPVRTAELEQLAQVAADSYADAFGHTMTEAELQQSLIEGRSVSYFEKTIDRSTILVAKEAERVVGYVQYGDVKIPEVKNEPHTKELGRLYVATDHQGQGIGRRLMKAALADPELANAAKVYLMVWEQNAKATALYESFNFETVGVTHFEVAGKPMQDLIMVRLQNA